MRRFLISLWMPLLAAGALWQGTVGAVPTWLCVVAVLVLMARWGREMTGQMIDAVLRTHKKDRTP